MMIQGVSISEMINQSMAVLTKPSVATFERFERHGGQREALTYIGIAAAISGAATFVSALLTSDIITALLLGILGLALPFVAFFVFAFIVFTMGKQQGGTGTQDEVFYTCALYTAPLLAINGVIGSIPVINCIALPATIALLIYQLYLGYLAARSSMNLEQTPAILSVGVAIVGQWIVSVVFGMLAGVLLSMFM